MSAHTAATPTAPADRSDSAVRRFLRNPLAMAGVIILGLLIVASLLAPLLTNQDPNIGQLRQALRGPFTAGHLLGTDSAGRDLLSRMLYGGRVSLLGALLAVGVAAFIGIPAGLLAGYYGKWFDSGAVWVSNLIQSLPGLVVLLAVRAVMGPSIWISMTVYGFILAPGFFRVVRSSVINVRGELYVDAARVSGLSDASIIGRHILTVVRAPAIIQASLLTGIALAIQSGLEFLGVGDNNVPSWGNILNEGFRQIYRAPLMLLWPSLAIGLTCASLVIIGNGLRDALEERGTSSGKPGRRRRTSKARPMTVTEASVQSKPLLGEAVGDAPAELPGDEDQMPVVVADDPLEQEAEQALQAAVSAPPVISDRSDGNALLAIENLSIGYGGVNPKVVVHDVNLHVYEGEVLGLVGESGSGKTQTAFSVLGLLPQGGRVLTGNINFQGRELTDLSPKNMRAVRGTGIAYIPQEPMSNLDPSFKIGSQLVRPMIRKLGIKRAEAETQALELLEHVGIPDPRRTFNSYPHQVSGGMAQRVLIAGAVSCKPRLLIADEPTTALDVTVQAEVLNLLRQLQNEYRMGIILVTHNFGVVADICDRVAVMQNGRIVEMAESEKIFRTPQHPYTQMLLGSTLEGAPSRIELDAAREARI